MTLDVWLANRAQSSTPPKTENRYGFLRDHLQPFVRGASFGLREFEQALDAIGETWFVPFPKHGYHALLARLVSCAIGLAHWVRKNWIVSHGTELP